MTRTGGPFEQDGGPFERDGGPFEQGGGPFERAEASSGGGPFEDWRQRGEDGTSRNSVESRKTTAAPSSSHDFPHAIPDDVQFFEPNLVSIIIVTIVIANETVIIIRQTNIDSIAVPLFTNSSNRQIAPEALSEPTYFIHGIPEEVQDHKYPSGDSIAISALCELPS